MLPPDPPPHQARIHSWSLFVGPMPESLEAGAISIRKSSCAQDSTGTEFGKWLEIISRRPTIKCQRCEASIIGKKVIGLEPKLTDFPGMKGSRGDQQHDGGAWDRRLECAWAMCDGRCSFLQSAEGRRGQVGPPWTLLPLAAKQPKVSIEIWG